MKLCSPLEALRDALYKCTTTTTTTYTVIWTYALNISTVVWLFTTGRYLTWKFKRLAILRDICMLLNGYFMSPALPSWSSAAIIRHTQRPWAQAHRPLVCPVNLTHCRRCPEPTPEARKTSITSLSVIFSGLGSRYPSPDRGVCHRHPRVHRSLTRPAN